jgi:hypothetical protein
MRIVFIPPIKWADLYQRPQQIATQLSRKFTVFWIDKPSFYLKALFRALFLRKMRLADRINDNLYVFQTFTFIPFSRLGIIKKINEIFWFIQIRLYTVLFFRRYEDIAYFVCFSLPLSTLLFKKGLLIYDRCDRFYEFKGATEKTRLDDVKLIEKASLVINSSETLWKEAKKHNENSILVRNGVDLANFQDVRNLKKESSRKVIGYIGAVAYWMDFDLLKKLAETYPEYEIHIIGPLMEKNEVQSFRNIENVKFFGKVPYNELPAKLKEFDIGIVPFKINELTKAVDPVKVYEYMAAGKNIVSTNLPELYRLKDYIYIGENREQFIKFCKEAIENPKVSPEILMKIAMENTWEKRATQIENEILKRALNIPIKFPATVFNKIKDFPF